jgi:uncharacterized protein YggU (UPF0235/DUF167 family)
MRVGDDTTERVLVFIKSPLLQGAALTSVVKLFQQLLVTPSKVTFVWHNRLADTS